VRTFEPPPDARWRVCPGAPERGEIVCHNDFAPWNMVYRDGLPAGLIDWDFAAPAPALWDVAYAAWRFVPLYYDGVPGLSREADVREYARRLALFCDEYGLEERGDLLRTVAARQQVVYDTVRVWGEAGVPGFAEMWATGHAVAPLQDKAFVEEHTGALASRL
jgi:aminoglycoside phosphotransferase (APT) family kinase protein